MFVHSLTFLRAGNRENCYSFSDSPPPRIRSQHCSACLAIAADSFSVCRQVSMLCHTPPLNTYAYPDWYVGLQ